MEASVHTVGQLVCNAAWCGRPVVNLMNGRRVEGGHKQELELLVASHFCYHHIDEDTRHPPGQGDP